MFEHYLNINSLFDYELYDPSTEAPITLAYLSKILSPSVAELELSRSKYVDIPEPVLESYASYRPTSLFRAKRFEEVLNTSCEIFIKDESESPSGTHKMNSAYLIANLIKNDNVQTVTTETTGNWGLAFAIANKEYSLNTICFMDNESVASRSLLKKKIEELDSKVVVVDNDDFHGDLLTLSADAAIEYTRKLNDSVYIFGSVFGYFLIPQSIVGLEARYQLQSINKYPDIVVGSCGGGANLMGLSAAFIDDIINNNRMSEIYSVESENCPILTKGKRGLFSIDTLGYYPLLLTYGLGGLLSKEYIGGLGSTIVSSSAFYFHSKGIIKADQIDSDEAKHASDLFFQTERIRVALESGYQLAGVIRKARSNQNKIILTNISSPIRCMQDLNYETSSQYSCLD